TAFAGQPQRLFLRTRPDRWKVAPRQAVRKESDLGERHRARWPSHPEPESGTERGGNQSVSLAERSHQLVLAVVQPSDRSVLPADLREMQYLLEARPRRVAIRQTVPGRIAAGRYRWESGARSQGHRHPNRSERLGVAAEGPGDFLGRYARHRYRLGRFR